jgi:hypothetical protein
MATRVRLDELRAVCEPTDTASHRRVFRVNGRMPRMTCTAVSVQQTVDGTPGGVFNRPF